MNPRGLSKMCSQMRREGNLRKPYNSSFLKFEAKSSIYHNWNS